MRSSACRRHSASCRVSCARALELDGFAAVRAAAAHETAGQRQRQCFAHGTLSTARSSLCIIPGRRLHCDRSRAHLKNIWKAFPRSIHDPDYNNTTYQQHNHAATAQTCASNTDTCRSASQRHRARLLRSYCCQVRSGGLHCRADAKTWPPASASAQHRHTSTYEARHWHRPNERARPCTRRRSPNLAAEPPPGPKGSFCCCWLATSLPTPAMGTRPIGVRKEGSARRWEVGKRTVKAVAWGGRSAGAGRTLKVSGRMSKVVLRCAT